MSDLEKNNQDVSAGKGNKPEQKKTVRPPSKRLNLSPGRVKSWWREMRSELKKVVWPTPKQVLNNSIIVAVAVVVVGSVIAIYDTGAYALVQTVIKSFVG